MRLVLSRTVKLLLLFTVAVASGLAAQSNSHSPAGVTGVVSWWPADQTARDVSGVSDGTIHGGVQFAQGVVGRAFLLNGTDAYIDLGNDASLSLSTGDFTVFAWVYFNSLTHAFNAGRPLGDMSIVDKVAATGADNSDGWRLIKQDDNRFWFCFGAGSNGCIPNTPTTVISSTVAVTGKWFNVVGVKSGSTISIYINGVLEASTNYYSINDSNSTDLLIGSNGQCNCAFVDGLVDEVSIYSRALGTSEVQNLYSRNAQGR